MKTNLVLGTISICLLFACKDSSHAKTNKTTLKEFQNQAHELVYKMAQKVGDYNKLSSKQNVEYTYTYKTPDGKTDISLEKYFFDGELSYGHYERHDRTFPQLKGTIEQGYDGTEYWLKHLGQTITDSTLLKRVAFNRPTNFYWFAMMPKLLDPGVNYEHLGEATVNDQNYDIVKVTFDSKDNNPTDIYQLYINKKTFLVDQFLFTVADFGLMDTPYLMQLQYEKVDDILIPSIRQYKKSSWKAELNDDPWINVTWSNIKFNTGITKSDFKM